MKALVFPDKLHPNDYRVEAFDDEGGCEVTILSGPRALDRARFLAHGFYEVAEETTYTAGGAGGSMSYPGQLQQVGSDDSIAARYAAAREHFEKTEGVGKIDQPAGLPWRTPAKGEHYSITTWEDPTTKKWCWSVTYGTDAKASDHGIGCYTQEEAIAFAKGVAEGRYA